MRTNDEHGDEVATVKSDAYYCHSTLDFDSWLWVVTGRESWLLSNSYVFHAFSFSLLPFIAFIHFLHLVFCHSFTFQFMESVMS